jgi:uncharacterized membrane protein
MTAFALWKTAHILSAAIIFGTGLGIAFFTWFGCRSAIRPRDIGALRSVLRLTVIADACLTAPAIAFQAVSGVVLMNYLAWPFASAWSFAVWALFVLAGACWIPVLHIQMRLDRESNRAPSIDALPAWFHAWFRRWFALGVPAFAAVIAIYYLMIVKPVAVAGS